MKDSIKQWYAVHTRARWEKKTASLFEKRGIEYYCPLNKILKQWSDRKKAIMEPLFKSYVFIYVSEADHLIVKQTPGVLNFVHWLGKPAVIKAVEIDIIKKFLAQHENVSIEPISVRVKDRVRILTGPFTMLEGEVVGLKKQSVKIMLPSLGFAMVAEIEKVNVEVIAESVFNQKSRPLYGTGVG